MRFHCAIVCVLSTTLASGAEPRELQPVPDKLVVLTFDDSVKSHFTIVRPILRKHGFGATFFVTEGFDFKTNKRHYMTWDEIAHLHRDGFEIGNHTRDHMALTPSRPDKLAAQLKMLPEQLRAIAERCRAFGIPEPTSFAWPGNGIHPDALPILRKAGIKLARRGGEPEHPYKDGRGFAYEPHLDHPLLIPSAGDARPHWKLDDFKRAVAQAQFGRIAVLQFHGVPDLAHPWVNSPVDQFQKYMQYLKDEGCTVIALRDLAKYADPSVAPRDAFGAVNDRKQSLTTKRPRHNFRTPGTDLELKAWLENMVRYHRFSRAEVRAATGLSAKKIDDALKRFNIRRDTKPGGRANAPLLVLPYPGGRHPRIGFRDGMIRPQRETKISVFLPWDEAGYVVVDVPEAIRRNDERTHGLLYLAHTHVPTMWTRVGHELEPVEWKRAADGTLTMERRLPNGVRFGTKIIAMKDRVRMEQWLHNGSREKLSNLRVQNCVMLSRARGFAALSNDNKLIRKPFVCCGSKNRDRWIITAWSPCQRAWSNPPCPCMHSDPQFPDCKPGETKRLVGGLWFYRGADIDAELKRIAATRWDE